MTLTTVKKLLRQAADTEKKIVLQRFFKTGPGEYGQGDIFIGVTVPRIRTIVRLADALPAAAIPELLHSPIHEERMLAVLLLERRYHRGSPVTQQQCYECYLSHTRRINNWDLVDSSAPAIVGRHLWTRERVTLYTLAQSAWLWDRRIAIVSTLWFIRQGQFQDTLRLSARLLADPHDLMHKAVGWMLREVGKRDKTALTGFLNIHTPAMPRTMLRYAIERFPTAERAYYLRLPRAAT